MDIDYLYYVCTTMLNWSEEQFIYSSLRHIMKQINIHIKVNSPNKGYIDPSNDSKKGKEDKKRKTSFVVLD